MWKLKLGFVAVTAVLVVAAGIPGSLAAREEPEQGPCEKGEHKSRGQGCARRQANGLYKVRTPDGEAVDSHGPDQIVAPGTAATDPTTSTAALPLSSSGFVCAGPGQPRAQLVYAVPQDGPDRSSTHIPLVRRMFYAAADQLGAGAAEIGQSARYRVACDVNGEPSVERAVLATPSSGADFSTIVGDLRRQQLGDPNTKYWTWYDGTVEGFGGQASICADDGLSADNCNLRGPSYAITYGQAGMAGAAVMMHEAAHNLGAVQLSAPASTGAFHCNDGNDVMCYDDGGPAGAQRAGCVGSTRFDCNHDDYFHPGPAATGSYLASHWNLGSCFNVYLDLGYCATGSWPNVSTGGDYNAPPAPRAQHQVQDGSASDSDGNMVSYRWSWVRCRHSWGSEQTCPALEEAAGTISGGHPGTPVTIPGPRFSTYEPGRYHLRLIVADDTNKEGSDDLVISVLHSPLTADGDG